MTMEIKSAKLNKNERIAELPSNNLKESAKVNIEGRSFVDEMALLPNTKADVQAEKTADVLNKDVRTDVQNSANTSKNDNFKSFDFISTPDFKGTFDKENAKILDKHAKHKAAEKELVDEIVLMNNKQNESVKKSVKSEFNKAQSSITQKNDNLIESEKKEFVSQKASKAELDVVKNSKTPELNEIKEEKTNFVSNENKSVMDVKPESKELEIFNVQTFEPSENVEALTLAEGAAEEVILPVKNAQEEIFKAPKALKQFSEIGVIVEKSENKNDIAKSNSEVNFEKPVVSKQEIKPNESEKIEVSKSEIKPEIFEKTEAVKFEPKVEKFEKSEVVKNEVKAEKITVAKVDSDKIQNTQKTQKTQIKADSEVTNEVSVKEMKIVTKDVNEPEFVQSETLKSEIQPKVIEKDVNKKVIEPKSEKTVKNIFDKVKPEKPEFKPDVEVVGKVKDVSETANVKSVDIKPIVEDVKVIKMEFANPLVDLNKSLNTTKTSDIVKFIDANLSTTNTSKTNKNSSSKSSELNKKAEEKAIKMTEADAKFFNNLVEANQQAVDVKAAEQNNLLKDVESAQAAKVSKTLLNALKESQETNKSFRVDFDKDISVVLRVSKNGQISAEFLPGDEAVEQYLRTNIPLLKQKFSDEGLEYNNLSYRQSKKENSEEKQRNNRGNKKENGYE